MGARLLVGVERSLEELFGAFQVAALAIEVAEVSRRGRVGKAFFAGAPRDQVEALAKTRLRLHVVLELVIHDPQTIEDALDVAMRGAAGALQDVTTLEQQFFGVALLSLTASAPGERRKAIGVI